MQDIKPIRVFLKVVELNSFTAAASALAMTPASVTRIVARLEADLGQQLLVRTTRQVALTSAGAAVAARFGPVVADFDRVREETIRDVRPNLGRLAISAPMSLGMRLLPDFITEFRLPFPEIDLDLQLTDTLIDIMTERCDLAIRISGPPGDKSTIWRKICEVPRRAIASPAHFSNKKQPETPDDLRSFQCLSYTASAIPEVWTFQRGGEERKVMAGTSVMSNNGDFLYALAKAGEGIVVLPDFIIGDGIARGEVLTVLEDWTVPPLWLTLFYPPYEVLPPLVATFTDFFEAYLWDNAAFAF